MKDAAAIKQQFQRYQEAVTDALAAASPAAGSGYISVVPIIVVGVLGQLLAKHAALLMSENSFNELRAFTDDLSRKIVSSTESEWRAMQVHARSKQ
jgi:hypothetical protein